VPDLRIRDLHGLAVDRGTLLGERLLGQTALEPPVAHGRRVEDETCLRSDGCPSSRAPSCCRANFPAPQRGAENKDPRDPEFQIAGIDRFISASEPIARPAADPPGAR
jgi:hypothetical protein